MELDIFSLLLRWLHILAAGTAIGGTLFCLVALLPGLKTLPDDTRQAVHEQIRRRWMMVVMTAIAVLLATGFVNFLSTLALFKDVGAKETAAYKIYNMAFGIKFLLALVVFFLASLLVGRSGLATKVRLKAGKWLTINFVLIALIVGLSGVLRSTHNQPKRPATVVPVSAPAKAPDAAPTP